MKILVLNGPNLNLLGLREPEIYGRRSYADLEKMLYSQADCLGVEIEIRQTNHEGVLVDWIQQAYGAFDGIILNPAAYTHTSIAIPDALKAVGIPTVEVHISDPDQREPFRHISYVRELCVITIKGKGLEGYTEALRLLVEKLRA